MSARQTDWTQTRTCNACGWTSKPTTAGIAEKVLRNHSCDLHRVRIARQARVEAREAACGPVRECSHKQAQHEHGTYRAYVLDKCRCRPCRDAHREYNRRRNSQQAYGRWNPYVDATPARNHVRWLMLNNVGLKRIVKVSGVSQGALWKLMYGKTRPDGSRTPTQRIRRETAQRLLAVEPGLDALADGAMIDATGTQRRVRALVACGWSMSKLGAEIGWTPGNFCPLVSDAVLVRARTARLVRDLYNRLWNVAPPNGTHAEKISVSRSKRYAAQRGWAPPLAWDDDTIDDPMAQPVVTSLTVTREARWQAQFEDAQWLAEQGLDDEAIADRLGVTVDGLQKRRERWTEQAS